MTATTQMFANGETVLTPGRVLEMNGEDVVYLGIVEGNPDRFVLSSMAVGEGIGIHSLRVVDEDELGQYNAVVVKRYRFDFGDARDEETMPVTWTPYDGFIAVLVYTANDYASGMFRIEGPFATPEAAEEYIDKAGRAFDAVFIDDVDSPGMDFHLTFSGVESLRE